MVDIVEYEDEKGEHPFSRWFGKLDAQTALKVRTAIARLELGNFSNVKAVGRGVSEYRLQHGPGYRIYFGMDGDRLVVLLGGGAKKRQSRDIDVAQTLWRAYEQRKRNSGV